jgi:tetratricopeptide (TPR) repeat protein
MAGLIGVVFFYMKKDNFYLKADEWLKAGDYQKALSLCLKKIDSRPQDYLIRYYIGEAYEGLKKYGEALHYYEKAALFSFAPGEENIKTQLYLRIAELNRKQLNYEVALSYYALVLDRQRRNTKALLASGEIFLEAKNYQKAKNYFERLIDINPDNINARNKLGWIYFQIHLFADAAKQLEMVLLDERVKIDKVFKSSVSFMLSDVCMEIKDFQKVIDTLSTLLTESDYFEEAVVKIVNALILQSKTEEALEMINKNIQKVSKEKRCELLYLSGKAYFSIHKYYPAIKSWEEAFKINPSYRDLSHINNEYLHVIRNPKMEYVFSHEDEKTQLLINSLAAPSSIAKLAKKPSYWEFKFEDSVYVLYKVPSQIPLLELREMHDLALGEFFAPPCMTVYSLYGVAREEGSDFDYKKVFVVSGDEFIKIVNEKLKV